MLGAFLTDRANLTPAKVRKRIAAGAPIYGSSPDRPFSVPRRVAFGELSPEGLASLYVRPQRQAGAPQRYVQDTGAIYQQAQTLLALWRKAGGPVDPPDFGDQKSDLSGENNPRTERALISFQRWANDNGDDLRTDGVLDQATIGDLVIVTAPAAQAQQSGTKSVWPLWVVGVATGIAVLYSEYGSTRVARSR